MLCFGFGRSEDRGNGGGSAIGVPPPLHDLTWKVAFQSSADVGLFKRIFSKLNKYFS